ncbi:malto-oligosyltrehalose synthase [Pseudomonas sp. MDMC216]|jgi:(1->4)-alpha-D-glucan 1-alpha-D-glucosylmutase|nr:MULTISPECIES: malto-oligosyltrehalose synthase [Pseudomonas]MDH1557918.1 malto-oligosyltrehalose synthase [Pseudomonas chengduensis]MDI5993840.1 malto-oligosyltrehalose synthase [Pseudomonas sp. MDMC216]MDI6009356.1 malto-oligosyltrehalose synthase [Pseudomonas sp. MDMC17]RAR36595.1 malto-oligosyltrehalose synthase [Pseudomonas sp. MDMC224]
MTELRATLRLQLHKDFTLRDAAAQVPYLAQLGISHLYASPILTARPDSQHGYDVIDPTRINPELGGEEALVRLVNILRAHDMGLILDIVPNHMAVGGDGNPWWLDVLEWGQDSPYADFFDIQWQSHDPLLSGQLLVPFLRSDYGEALRDGTLELVFDGERGRFHAQHFEHRLPLTPSSYASILRSSDDAALRELGQRFARLGSAGDSRTQAEQLCAELAAQAHKVRPLLANFQGSDEAAQKRLHALLERQHYRVASWRTAADDINWRRFFDINELGALRVEHSQVFEQTHAKVFELIERGLIDGLRIDHIDGLANPRAYCSRLRRRIRQLRGDAPFPIFVEKILGAGEQLPQEWPVDGSTGYEFMNQVSLLQHDPHGELPLSELWQALSGRPTAFEDEIQQARRLVLEGSLAGDLEEVAQRLLHVARHDIATRDLTLGAIRRALRELIVHFPVYRTYAQACGRSQQDRRFFQQALDGARQTLAEADWPLLPHLDDWLGGAFLRALPPGRARRLRAQALTRFQQLTSPVAAKAVEDTALYRAGVLLSRYDVGFDAEHFSASVERFHQACAERANHHPLNLLATATHDHKRGEDCRARLAVLSERAAWYAERVRHWQHLAQPLRSSQLQQAPDAGEEAILYQALIGSWPLGLQADDDVGLDAYLQRLLGWQRKALREAKLNSAWSAPNDDHESACADFLRRLLVEPDGLALRRELASTVTTIAPAGALNGLTQCLLRMTTPGVPDLYQGCEFWDFSLVDPDNRRPVDFAARQAALQAGDVPAAMLASWQNGRIKQWLIQQVLAIRAAHSSLFSQGSYQPLAVTGRHAAQVLAFLRSHGDEHLLVIVPRLTAGLLAEHDRPHVPAHRWGDTTVVLPVGLNDGHVTGLLTPCQVATHEGVPLADALAELPVNLLRLTP